MHSRVNAYARRARSPAAPQLGSGRVNEAGQATLGWQLATVTLDGQGDLDSMRRQLADKLEYLEADLTAFTSVRALRVAAQGGLVRGVTDGECR